MNIHTNAHTYKDYMQSKRVEGITRCLGVKESHESAKYFLAGPLPLNSRSICALKKNSRSICAK